MTARSSVGLSEELAHLARAQAPSLHRTAVMLTGDASRADALVLAALRGLGEHQPRHREGDAWTVDDIGHVLRDELVHAYLADARHHRRDAAEVSDRGDPADVLASLAPRARAATVLVRAEGWSYEEAGAALGVGPGRVATLVPPTSGLDLALEGIADRHARPDRAVLADVLTSLTSSATEPDEGAVLPRAMGGAHQPKAAQGRRWGVRLLVVAALLVTGAGVGAALLDEDAIPQTVEDGATGTGAAEAAADLTRRGWVLDGDGTPPAYKEGLRLLESVTIDYARAAAPLELDTQPGGRNAVFAALWCDIPALDANLAVPVARLTFSGEAVTLPCAGKNGEPGVVGLVPLPPRWSSEPPFSVAWSGDLPGRGTAVLATYAETGLDWELDQVPPVGTAPPLPPGTVLLDATDVHYPVDGVDIFAQRLVLSDRTRLTVWAGGTGSYMVLVDGVVASDDGDLAMLLGPASGVWRSQHPELRDGFWTVPVPGHATELEVPAAVRPGPGQVSEATLTVVVDADVSVPWQVRASHATVVDLEPAEARSVPTDDLVEIPGRRLVGAWEVPMTGYPYPLATPPSLSPDTAFTAIAPTDVILPGSGWSREGIASSGLGTVSMPSGLDEYDSVSFLPYWRGWGRVPPGSSLGTVSAAYLGYSSSVDHVTVVAYEPDP